MVTIISGTNRKNNNTKKIALEYQRLLKEMQIDSHFLALDEINVAERNDLFRKMEKDYLEPSDKFIIIMPEYNGSYPGILKLMIDNWYARFLILISNINLLKPKKRTNFSQNQNFPHA